MSWPQAPHQQPVPYPPVRPPRKSKVVPVVLSIGAVLVVAAVATTVVLLSTGSDPKPQAAEPAADSGQVVDNRARAGLTYRVPSDWVRSDEAVPGPGGVTFTGVAEYGVYQCAGKEFFRTRVASGRTPVTNAADAGAQLHELAAALGEQYFKGGSVLAGAPRRTEFGGLAGQIVTATVTAVPSPDGCVGTAATVTVIGIPGEAAGLQAADSVPMSVLFVASDSQGGPPHPAPLPAEAIAAVIDSASR
ncbi:hypothetical protein [Amycolatopsis suaedae]|uniref:DUF8017 domain-containing protein n=1 Tax=Amycolatopsis suaedae TaxID=2510978 RepID=A0A4Q7J444_9PSEU|nr:hypothetical protein [Amycolatopsis suaedae]RZQ62311.1 hypothetical protein EWH70_18720 [Amycolatopsis suaedae]